MNKQFEKEGKKTRISRTTIAKYLKNRFDTPRKMKKIFITNDKKRRNIIILKKDTWIEFKGERYFFTDENQMDSNLFVNENITGKHRKI